MQQILLIKSQGSLETCVTPWHVVMITTYKQSSEVSSSSHGQNTRDTGKMVTHGGLSGAQLNLA